MSRYDIIFLVGLVLVTAGFYFVWPPLALIVPGVAFCVVGVFGARGLAARDDGEER